MHSLNSQDSNITELTIVIDAGGFINQLLLPFAVFGLVYLTQYVISIYRNKEVLEQFSEALKMQKQEKE